MKLRLRLRGTSNASLSFLDERMQPKDQARSAFCKARLWKVLGSGMANDLALHEIDHQLGDVGGMIGHPFEVFGNEAQANGA